MKYILLIVLTGCIILPYVEPQQRNAPDQAASLVIVDVRCGAWHPYRIGSGVIISERYVLTVEHLVSCPLIPDVHVTLNNGRRFRVWVIKESEREDLAKLEIASAENFGLGVPPPKLWVGSPVGEWACGPLIFPYREWPCGRFGYSDTIQGFRSGPGNSGAAVYIHGQLVGLITSSMERMDGVWETRVTFVGYNWLYD